MTCDSCVIRVQVCHLANPVETLVMLQAWGPESPTRSGAVLQELLSSSGVCILAPFNPRPAGESKGRVSWRKMNQWPLRGSKAPL